ncbi:MAG: fumarylacetoacetate hydrolase family protein, partial [Chloroflexi bacterium]|nr:fumarylacetoacetate hydrolase family protein [Chloroflexota bacterium]
MRIDRHHTYLVRATVDSSPRWGVVEDGRVYELAGTPFDGWECGAEMGLLDNLQLLAPIVPTKIIGVGRNYPAHAAEHGREVPPEPLLFFKPPSSVIGPGTPIILPPQSEQVEHEAELAIVIGRRCRDVRPQEAWDYVLGVTCGNDVTARDLQRRDDQWVRAKG